MGSRIKNILSYILSSILGILCLALVTVLIYSLTGSINRQLNSNTINIETTSQLPIITSTITKVYGISSWEAEIYGYMAMKFPYQWHDYIALIKIESNFKTSLTSSQNCKGLTQLHPETMQEVCKRMGIEFNNDLIWNDVLNVMVGFTYLTEAFKKDSVNAFRIYIGGPAWAKAGVEHQITIEKYVKAINRESEILKLVYMGLEQKEKNEAKNNLQER